MKALIPLAAAALALQAGGLATDYSAARTLKCSVETALELETTVFTMERDGEPLGGGFGAGGTSLEQRTVEESFRVLEHADGAPTKVRRAFETVQRKTASEMGGETSENEEQGPLQGVTLELALEDGEVAVEVVEGRKPDQEAVLQGHALTLAWDGLLPPGDAAEGESYDLEPQAILRALSLDLDGAYFPRPERAEGGADVQGGRDGNWRSSPGRRPSALRNLATAKWEGTATRKGEVEEDGVACVEIALKLKAEGELEAFSFGGGGPRGGRAAELPAGPAAADNTIEAELAGRLLFALEGRHPVLLELEGEVSTVRHGEFERNGSKMVTHSEQEGTLTLHARLAAEKEQ
jgi:hypothetical protein